jgi:hypothetical protein
MSTFSKDWAAPRSCRAFTGYVPRGQNPSGTILHVVNNTPVPCCEEEYKKNPKAHVSFTVVGVKQLGYVYAPWKKSKSGSAGKPEGAQKLFDDVESVFVDGERVLTGCKVYTFPRENKMDKGPRVEENPSRIVLGQTLHFMLQEYMYEKKSKGEDVFDHDGVRVIEPFNVLEIVISPVSSENAAKGYGLALSMVRSLPYSLYSYMSSVNIGLLETTYEALATKMSAMQTTESESIRMQLDSVNMGFLCKVAPGSYLIKGVGDGMFKIITDDATGVAPGIPSIDISKDDLLRFTNAGTYFIVVKPNEKITCICIYVYVYVYRL